MYLLSDLSNGKKDESDCYEATLSLVDAMKKKNWSMTDTIVVSLVRDVYLAEKIQKGELAEDIKKLTKLYEKLT